MRGIRIGVVLSAVMLMAAPMWAAETRIGPKGQVIVDGRPVIPLGVWQQPTYLFNYHRQLGMNCLVWPPGSGRRTADQDPGYFPAAEGAGLGCIVHYADAARSQPAVWGWVGPTLYPRRGGAARRYYEDIRARDAGHFVQCNIPAASLLGDGNADFYREALKSTDCVVSHVWPEMGDNGTRNLRNVAELVDRLRRYSADRPGGEVSIWPDINPHKWSKKGGRPVYPAPTTQELRFQIWLALVHGADGVCFFPISFEPFVYAQIPAQNEQELIRTTALVTRFADVLTAEESPLSIDVTGSRTGGIVDYTTRRHGGADYVFVLNGTTKGQTIRLRANGLGRMLRLQDAITDAPLAIAQGAHEEAVRGLDLRIWKLTGAAGQAARQAPGGTVTDAGTGGEPTAPDGSAAPPAVARAL